MNILYISADRGIPVRGHKGAAVHVRALTTAFAHLGHTVTILTPRPGPADGPAPAATLLEVPLPALLAGVDEPTAQEHQAQAYNERLYVAAHKHLAQGGFDMIYERYSLWSDVGARLAQAVPLPFVLEVNAPLREEAVNYRHLANPDLAAEIETRQFGNAHAISVVSGILREYVMGRGADPDRVRVLTNGVDRARFHPAVRGGRIRHQLNLGKQFVVGFVGRPRPWHDLDTLIAAFACLHRENPNTHLLLVGEMPQDLPGKFAAHALPASAVTTTGAVPHDDIPEYLAAMDVAVSPHPALNDFYFSPLKLFEYLACGVPTIATGLGQPAEIIQHGKNGLLFPPGDVDALATQIRWLIDHPAEARELAWEGAVDVLEHHTWEQNARSVIDWATPRGIMPLTEAEGDQAPEPGARPVKLPILDSKLRQRLFRATQPELVAPFLAEHLPFYNKRGTLQAVEGIAVFKYKPGRRCVLAYDLIGKTREGQPADQRVIGKVFRDERGQQLLALQQYLWDHGFAEDAPDQITVPRPLAYIPEMRMMVQGCAPGTTFNGLVVAGGWQTSDLNYWTTRGAQALAKLHNLPLPTTGGHPDWMREPYLLNDERASLDRFAEGLADMRPADATRVYALRDTLQLWAAQLPPLQTPVPVHRDYYYSQLLFNGEHLSLIDFDLTTMGDPALDVANFVAHLFFLGLDRLDDLHALAPQANRFLEAYAFIHGVDVDFLQRFAFYQAATLFRLLHVIAPRPALAHHFYTLYNFAACHLEFA